VIDRAMRQRLTNVAVEGARCPEGRKDMMIFDADLPGFGLRVTAAGSRIFFLQYKAAGRGRRATIGRYGELTAAQARRKAEALRGQVREHRDPVAETKLKNSAAVHAEAQARSMAARDAFTVAALIDGWRDHHLVERSISYRSRVPREMKASLKPWITTTANSFSHADAIQVLDRAKIDRGPIAANRLQAVCRACWGWALKRGVLEANPWTSTPRPTRERSRERVLTDLEIAAAWNAAKAMSHPWNLIIPLLILTGQRRQEVAGMMWSEIDLDAGIWRLPPERTKNGRGHLVPLVPAALEMIRQAPRLGTFVFSNSKSKAPSGFGKVAARLVATTRAAGGTERWVLHDLRRTAATGLQRLGVRLEVTESLLNHVSGSRAGIVGVYQRHGWDREKRVALDAWAALVIGLPVNGEASSTIDPTSRRRRKA
jgi:integrase